MCRYAAISLIHEFWLVGKLDSKWEDIFSAAEYELHSNWSKEWTEKVKLLPFSANVVHIPHKERYKLIIYLVGDNQEPLELRYVGGSLISRENMLTFAWHPKKK